MEIKVVVPQMGQSIAEATILKWHRSAGERIEKGEVLVEIGTDKVDTEIPAPETGVVARLLAHEGDVVPVNSEIAVLSMGEEMKTGVPGAEPQEERHSPLVRKLAREHEIDLASITGTGEGGRITKDDVLKAVERKKSTAATLLSAVQRVPMSRMRKLIAENMMLSKRTAADLTTFFEVDMTEVAHRRETAKDTYNREHGFKLTFLPFVIAASAGALKAFPVVNSSIEGEEILYKTTIDIGIAVALEDGLLVPVIRNADQKSVLEIAKAAHELSERAHSKKLQAAELQGGTFTITNPGVFGALMGTPIILPPQVAILGLGAVQKRAVIVDDAIAIRSMAYLCLTYDHRAMDGATADRFLAHIKHTLENECPSPLD